MRPYSFQKIRHLLTIVQIFAIVSASGLISWTAQFVETVIDDNVELNPQENIHASLIGLAVDYLTSFMMGTPVNEAFKISLLAFSMLPY